MPNIVVPHRSVQRRLRASASSHKMSLNNSSGNSLSRMTEWTKQKLVENPEWFVTDCVASNYPREIHSWNTWKYLQNVYQEEVLKFGRTDDEFTSWNSTQTGMQIPHYIRDDGPRGRSVYTAIPIPKGTRIWKPSKLATFEHPQELVSFLRRLPHDLHCDALLWAYPDEDSETVGLALDVGTYVNHADSKELLNLDTSCRASRDIHAGEELLEDYSKFIGIDTLEWFNIIRSAAWHESSSTNLQDSFPEGEPGIHHGYVHIGVPTSASREIASEHVVNFFPTEPSANADLMWRRAVLIGAICFVGLFSTRYKILTGKSRFKPYKSMA
jgi:hypothetical protein